MSSTKRVIVSIQVRMGSGRLPGKMMTTVGDGPLLGHLLDRVVQSRRIDGLVVATSAEPRDDVIEAYCRGRGIACFRGSEDDVLGRMAGALAHAGADVAVILYGDGPLIDPRLVDEMIERFFADEVDFLGNDLATTYPAGMEVEVVRMSAIADADRRCQDPAIREHGTLFIRRHPELYAIRNVAAPPSLHRPDVAVEVDEAADLPVIAAVLDHFQPRRDFSLAEILEFLDRHPELAASNAAVARRWKTYRENHA